MGFFGDVASSLPAAGTGLIQTGLDAVFDTINTIRRDQAGNEIQKVGLEGAQAFRDQVIPTFERDIPRLIEEGAAERRKTFGEQTRAQVGGLSQGLSALGFGAAGSVAASDPRNNDAFFKLKPEEQAAQLEQFNKKMSAALSSNSLVDEQNAIFDQAQDDIETNVTRSVGGQISGIGAANAKSKRENLDALRKAGGTEEEIAALATQMDESMISASDRVMTQALAGVTNLIAQTGVAKATAFGQLSGLLASNAGTLASSVAANIANISQFKGEFEQGVRDDLAVAAEATASVRSHANEMETNAKVANLTISTLETPINTPDFIGNFSPALSTFKDVRTARAGRAKQKSSSGAALGSAGIGAAGSLGSAAIIAGAIASDRNMKEDVVEVNPIKVLESFKKLNTSTWKYKEDTNLGRDKHVGPMAQDIQELFGVGDGKTIALVDMMGIWTTVLKGLSLQVSELRSEVSALKESTNG